MTTLWDLVGTDMVSGSLDNVLASRPGFDRLPSINAFDKVTEQYINVHLNLLIVSLGWECCSERWCLSDVLNC